MSDEREQAEQLFSYIHYHSGEKGIDAILAFAREERARGIEEFVKEYEAHKWSWGGPVKSLIQFGREYLISKLREEGGQNGN